MIYITTLQDWLKTCRLSNSYVFRWHKSRVEYKNKVMLLFANYMCTFKKATVKNNSRILLYLATRPLRISSFPFKSNVFLLATDLAASCYTSLSKHPWLGLIVVIRINHSTNNILSESSNHNYLFNRCLWLNVAINACLHVWISGVKA